MRRATALVIFLLLAVPGPVAAAQAVSPCYPPPCNVQAPAQPGQGGVPADLGTGPVVGQRSAPATDRSPVPIVVMGLLMAVGSLAVVALRRRQHIVRRSAIRRPPIVATGHPEPQAALR